MDTIDDRILELLERMLVGRNDIFNSTAIRSIPATGRSQILSRYMMNELSILEFLNRIYVSNVQVRNAAASLISLTTLPTSFLNPVTVAPTEAQLHASLIDEPVTGNTVCAICQDDITNDGCRIRQCGHVYHWNCARSWFSMSVRCPVCRHDIREPVDPVAETSSASQ
jgi:hypothetical protein